MKTFCATRVIALVGTFILIGGLLGCGTGGSVNLQKIQITPANPTLAKGDKLQLSATGIYTDGHQESLTTNVTWSTSQADIAAITAQGEVSAMSQGAALVTAAFNGVAGNTNVTIGAPVLVGISVTPNPSSLPIGESEQLTATGTYSDGSSQVLTPNVTWSSSGSNIASVSSSGSVQGASMGTATINAASGTISGSAAVTVAQGVLLGITVSPGTSSLPLGESEQLTATGNYSDGSTQNLTQSVTWAASATTVSVNSTGSVVGMAVGTATVTASLASVTGNASVAVGQAALLAIAVTPAQASVPLGESTQLAATGTFSDGSTQNLTQSATWTSSAAGTASVNAQGSVVANAVGSATISATVGAVGGNASVTVAPAALLSITVSPGQFSLPLDEMQQLTATGNYSDGSTQNLTQSATWSSSSATIATVNSSGAVKGTALGTATISAASGTISGSSALTVGQAALVSIAVSPSQSSLPMGEAENLTAMGNYSDGSTQNLTQSAAWSSLSSSIATAGPGGAVKAVAMGSATISAAVGSVAGNASVTVAQAALLSISVTPAQSSVPIGQNEQFAATGSYSDNSTHDLTQSATWTATGGASVGATGLAHAQTLGSATITAANGSITGSAGLMVTALQGDNTVYFVTHYSNNVAGAPDATVRVINDGSTGGTLYADFFVFDDSEELITCCSCPITPDGLLSESVGSVTAVGLRGYAPTRGVIKMISSSNGFFPQNHDPVPPAQITSPGLRAWATHVLSFQDQNPSGPAPFSLTETPLAAANLTSGEQNLLETLCWVDIAEVSGAPCPCTPEDYDF